MRAPGLQRGVTREGIAPRAESRMNSFPEILVGTAMILAGLRFAKECLEIRAEQKRGRS